MKRERVLITGNMGYVGPLVVEQLREHVPGVEIIGLDSGYFAHCLTGIETLPETAVDLQIFSDVRDFDPAVMENVTAVVHLAGVSNDPIGNAFSEVTEDINYHTSVKLAQAAKEHGVRSFVFASSCSVYGFTEGGARRESDALNALTAYSRSKIATEHALEPLSSPDFCVTSLRFATACGMSPRLRLDLVLNDFVASAAVTGKVEILSDGTPWRPLIHVHDMARAIHWGIQREADNGGVYLAVNTGSDVWNYQVADLGHAVAARMHDVDVSINTDAAPDQRSYRVDFDLFSRLAADFQPEITLDMAIDDLYQGLDRMKFDDPGFRNSQFMRLKILSRFREIGVLREDLRWANR